MPLPVIRYNNGIRSKFQSVKNNEKQQAIKRKQKHEIEIKMSKTTNDNN